MLWEDWLVASRVKREKRENPHASGSLLVVRTILLLRLLNNRRLGNCSTLLDAGFGSARAQV
jgi:hypothetical protein